MLRRPDNQIQIATEEDVYRIYEFAKGRYEESRINGPEIKLPWWRVNPNIFHVIHGKHNCIQANLNLIPLHEDIYLKLRRGKIYERDILPENIYTLAEKKLVRYVYVEGFNCMRNSHVYIIVANFGELLRSVAETNNTKLVIGAIGGTKEGIALMKKLGFEIVSSDVGLQGKNFFEIDYQTFARLNNGRFKVRI